MAESNYEGEMPAWPLPVEWKNAAGDGLRNIIGNLSLPIKLQLNSQIISNFQTKCGPLWAEDLATLQ